MTSNANGLWDPKRDSLGQGGGGGSSSFMALHITRLHSWVHSLTDWGCEFLGECDCSGHFNNVTPRLLCVLLRSRWCGSKGAARGLRLTSSCSNLGQQCAPSC